MISTKDLIDKFQFALSNKWGYIWGTAGVVWTAAKQAELEKTTDADREMGRKYGKKWIGHTVADCSGLFTWAFKQLGGTMYHGSNTMYEKYCTSKGKLSNGKRDDGQELKSGTAVFTYNSSKKNYGHVGLYIGDGKVIEAKGTQNGVICSAVTEKKWVNWGELKGVDYGTTTSTPASDDNLGFPVNSGWRPTIKRGDKNDTVKECQMMLHTLGYDIGKNTGIDSDFGRMTESAVMLFQYDHKLIVDGICGPMTWDALDKAIAALKDKPKDETVRTYTVRICGLDLTQAQKIAAAYGNSSVIEEGSDGK